MASTQTLSAGQAAVPCDDNVKHALVMRSGRWLDGRRPRDV